MKWAATGWFRRWAITRAFSRCCADGGALDGARILGPRTLAFMTSEHLGPGVDRSSPCLVPGHGLGLGFAVRIAPGLAPTAGSVGEFFWGGVAGTAFFVSPRDELSAILMLHAPNDYLRYRHAVPQSRQRGDPLSAERSPHARVRHRRPGLGRRQRLALLQQFDRNVVGRADERHVAVARRPVDVTPAFCSLRAIGVDVVDLVGEMAEIAPAGVGLRVPVVGEFDQRRLVRLGVLDIVPDAARNTSV